MPKLDISIIFVIVIFIEAILLYRMYTNAKRHIQKSQDIRHTCDDLVKQMEALKSENTSLKQQIGQLTEQNNKNSKDYFQQLKHARHTCDDFSRSASRHFSIDNSARDFSGESTEKSTRNQDICIHHNSHTFFFLLIDLMISLTSLSV